jgi:hypothetical protein
LTFEDEIKEFTKSIPAKLEHIDSEETSKIALITPFLRLMGYDTTNPAEVKAEYTADVGTKQGEKVDFAILEDGHPIIFIECKSATNELSTDNISQLFRYFSITDIQIGILTNGIEYKFFTTGEDNSRMDEKPFLDIDILNLTKKDIKELEKFKKVNFDIDEVVSRADNLKYRNLIKKTLLSEFENPSEEFIRAIGKQVYDGILTQNVKEKFGTIIAVAISEIINEKINKTLSDAVASNEEEQEDNNAVEAEEEINEEVVTTELEKEAYFIVKSIASEIIDVNRVAMRDRKHYCNILFDDNQRFPIVRLYFNNANHLRVEFYDNITLTKNGGKIGDKIDIEDVSDLYSHKKRILNVIKEYLAMG